jgi:hypothetical protein
VALVHPFSDGSLTRLSLRPGLRERALTPFVPGGPAAQQLTARDGRWRVCAALAIDAAPPTRFLGTYQERRRANAAPIRGSDRGSRTGRLREGRLRRLPSRRAVTTPWDCLGLLPGGGRAGAPGASFGERAAPGWGIISTPLPSQAWPGRAKPSSMLLDDGQRSVYRQFRRQGPAEDGSHDPRPGGEPAPGPVA